MAQISWDQPQMPPISRDQLQMAQMHCRREDQHTIVAIDDGGSDRRETSVRTDVVIETKVNWRQATVRPFLLEDPKGICAIRVLNLRLLFRLCHLRQRP